MTSREIEMKSHEIEMKSRDNLNTSRDKQDEQESLTRFLDDLQIIPTDQEGKIFNVHQNGFCLSIR